MPAAIESAFLLLVLPLALAYLFSVACVACLGLIALVRHLLRGPRRARAGQGIPLH